MRPGAVAWGSVAAGLVAAGLVAAVISMSLTAAPAENTGQATCVPARLAEPSSGGSRVPPPGDPVSPDGPVSPDAPVSPDHPGPPGNAVLPGEQAALAEAVFTAVHNVAPGSEIGLAVYDQHTETLLTSMHADQQFYTASVVKLLIVIHVLHEAGWQVPTGSEREDLVLMLSRSADWVASTLWDAYGGPAITGEVAALVGLADTSPPTNPEHWEMTRMSPRDVQRVYEYIDAEMPPDAREFVLTALSEATDLAADGFDQFFGIPSALPGTEWAIKQGWMRINNGLVLNTTGVLGSDRRYVVVLLTRQPGGTDFADSRAAVTAGIAALAPTLTEGSAGPPETRRQPR